MLIWKEISKSSKATASGEQNLRQRKGGTGTTAFHNKLYS